MSDDSGQDDDTQWTEPARDQFRVATDELIMAIRDHGRALLAMTGRRAEVPRIFESGDRISEAASAFAHAQFELTGTFPSFELSPDDSGHSEEYNQQQGDDEATEPAGRISVLHRADYRVIDVEGIMRAGQNAYMTAWPDDVEEDAVLDVSQLGRALYQIMHVGGLSSLSGVPGLEPAGSTTWILGTSESLDEYEPNDWPSDPFALGEDSQKRIVLILEEE
jgi:hypothetical protein